MKRHIYILYSTTFLLCSTLTSCHGQKSSKQIELELGNFTINLDDGFQAKKLYGNDLEDAKNIFKPTGFPPPNTAYLKVKNNNDFFSFMAIANDIGKSYGKNENFTNTQIQQLFEIIKDGVIAGNLEKIKINNFNIIKHIVISSEYQQKICFYYIFDYDQMVNLFVSYPIQNDKWEATENFILKSLKRVASSTNLYSLNDKDEIEIKSILKVSMQGDTLPKEKYIEFWSIIDRYGGNPHNIEQLGSKEKLLDFIDDIGLQYQKAFYEDALISLRTGQEYESEDRNRLGKKLSDERKLKNSELMARISKKQTIEFQGENIVFDEDIIEYILNNIDRAFSVFKYNIDMLYNKSQ